MLVISQNQPPSQPPPPPQVSQPQPFESGGTMYFYDPQHSQQQSTVVCMCVHLSFQLRITVGLREKLDTVAHKRANTAVLGETTLNSETQQLILKHNNQF